MAANQQGPNPSTINGEIESVTNLLTSSIDEINNLSLQSLYSNTAGRTPVGRFLRERATLLRGLVNEVDNPILKSFATEMLDTMSGWFNDPEVLCCLIQAIFETYQASVNPDNQEIVTLSLEDTEFGDFLDKLIAFIDLIIAFVSRDLRSIVFFIPDFIKEIFGALMGAILLVLQETLYTIRDSVLQSILDWIDESVDGGQLWAACLPFQQFLDILKKYVSDYGLFAEIFEKIRGFISGKKSSFSREARLLAQLNKDLEFLRWFRDLLVKLKRAVVNFDLCVEHTYIPDNTYAEDPDESTPTDAADVVLTPDEYASNTEVPPDQKVPIVVSDDGRTVAISDTDARLRAGDLPISDNPAQARTQNGAYITRLSNDSVANFIKNNYDFSPEVVEQAINKVSADCPGFPGGRDLKNYLDRIRNRNAT